jgi:adenylate cyclase
VVEQRVERKLSAILAADVAGYSGLMSADEEGTLAQLKSCRLAIVDPKIDEHRGRIVKTTGDGMLVQFASVVDALRCAVEVQRGMVEHNVDVPQERRIEFRMGINVGDIIIDADDIYGDGVNIAARLEGLAEPGGICVSLGVRDQVRSKLDLAFEDVGEQRLKNIAWAVRVYRVRLGGGTPTLRPAMALPDKPSIAVLPFDNMSCDTDQEYFSDGITEDIITELSRFKNLFVIARHSSFAYRGDAVGIEAIARELGVEYVLAGSVRKAGQRVRITAQLIDAASGKHIWAERYDFELTDIFAVQDEVTSSIVGTLAVELEAEALERAKYKPPEHLEAYDHWLRGKRLIFLMGEKSLEARQHFERAAAVDPTFSRAHSGLGMTYQMEALDFPLPNVYRAASDKALGCAQQALALDETNHQAHLAMAYACLYRHDWDLVESHILRAIKLSPSDSDILANAAHFLALIGEAEEGLKFGRAALRLNPHYPDWYLSLLETPLFAMRNYTEALAIKQRSADAFIDSRFSGAAILAHLGRLEEARVWAEKGISRLGATPGGALAIAEGRVVELLLRNNPWRHPDDREHFAEGMLKAGVPG